MRFTEGQRVNWYRVLGAGYGFTEIIPATVLRETPKGLISIEAEKKDGTKVRRTVKQHSLKTP